MAGLVFLLVSGCWRALAKGTAWAAGLLCNFSTSSAPRKPKKENQAGHSPKGKGVARRSPFFKTKTVVVLLKINSAATNVTHTTSKIRVYQGACKKTSMEPTSKICQLWRPTYLTSPSTAKSRTQRRRGGRGGSPISRPVLFLLRTCADVRFSVQIPPSPLAI